MTPSSTKMTATPLLTLVLLGIVRFLIRYQIEAVAD